MKTDASRLRWADNEIRECRRVLAKSGLNLVGEVLRGFGDFTEFEHYPPDDVYDPASHAQYYFHAHPPGTREWADYGHFHIFLRPDGAAAAPCHLIALSMTQGGEPERLFTTNRWVTDEAWRPADEVIALLDRCVFDLAWPSWPLNRWLTAMLVRHRRDIEALVRERDQVVAAWGARHPGGDVFEDRALEVVSLTMIG